VFIIGVINRDTLRPVALVLRFGVALVMAGVMDPDTEEPIEMYGGPSMIYYQRVQRTAQSSTQKMTIVL
jgi:hypothetical protein